MSWPSYRVVDQIDTLAPVRVFPSVSAAYDYAQTLAHQRAKAEGLRWLGADAADGKLYIGGSDDPDGDYVPLVTMDLAPAEPPPGFPFDWTPLVEH